MRRVWLERLVVAALVSTFILICVGAYVVKIGAGQACPAWPKCFDDAGSGLADWAPFLDPHANLHGIPANMVAAEWIHRLIASVVTVMVAATAVLAWRVRPADRAVRTLGTLAAVFFVAQIALGGVTVLLANAPWTVVLHQGNAMLVFGTLVALATLLYASPQRRSSADLAHAQAPAPSVEPSGREPGLMTSRPWTATLQKRLGAWVELVKPGILLLLVMCGGAAMFLAGRPTATLVTATLAGGAFAAMSAATLNNVLDRKRDAKMARTKKRSIPSARITVAGAIVFAGALEAASFAILWHYANLLTALLALAGILFYVFYTIVLKPTTAQNIVIGGAAGAAPALVGWAAVTGDLGSPAVVLGFIIFAWTPPHFWALALVYKKDYEGGDVPMLPVTAGESATRKQILVYAVLTVLATLLFVPMGILGVLYGVVAVVLGAWFVFLAAKLLVRKDNKTAYGLFAYSILYLALLFGAMVADRLLVG